MLWIYLTFLMIFVMIWIINCCFEPLISYCMIPSPHIEANSRPAVQWTGRLLRNLNVPRLIYNRPPLVTVLNLIFLTSTRTSFKLPFPSDFQVKRFSAVNLKFALARPFRPTGVIEVGLYCFFKLCARWGLVVSVTTSSLYSLERDPVTILREGVMARGPVWTGARNLTPTGIRSSDRPARSTSPYLLYYSGPLTSFNSCVKYV
jgi:hypothetical protein